MVPKWSQNLSKIDPGGGLEATGKPPLKQDASKTSFVTLLALFWDSLWDQFGLVLGISFLVFFLMWRRSFLSILRTWASRVRYGGSTVWIFFFHLFWCPNWCLSGCLGHHWELILGSWGLPGRPFWGSGGTPGRIWCAVVAREPWCLLASLHFEWFLSQNGSQKGAKMEPKS